MYVDAFRHKPCNTSCTWRAPTNATHRYQSGLSFSRIVYGMWRIGDDTDTSPRHVQAKIEACLEQGITPWIRPNLWRLTRGSHSGAMGLESAIAARQIEIVTKCGIVAPAGRHSAARVKHYDTGAKHINASVEASLRDMNTDRIDLLLIHRPDRCWTGRDRRDAGCAGGLRQGQKCRRIEFSAMDIFRCCNPT